MAGGLRIPCSARDREAKLHGDFPGSLVSDEAAFELLGNATVTHGRSLYQLIFGDRVQSGFP